MIRVMANGCFDGLHVGHVAHLQAARKLGDMLIVTLTLDLYVNKGPGKPVFPWRERCRMLKELRCVDRVVESTDAMSALVHYRPEIYVKGIEYEGQLPEKDMVEAYGGRVVFLNTLPVYSSTKILSGDLLRDRIRATEQRSD
jgi:rfaE bifunctional protein nucleotidyltransferase chain/domain